MTLLLWASVSKLLYFFCAGKVGRIWHETFLSSSIDDMQVRKLHTSPEIFPQSSSKLVNDASLMSFSQQATVFFLCREGRSNLTWNISILINWWNASEKLHTNPEIIPQISSKLVNDASLMKLHSGPEFFSQKATEFFLCREGSYVEIKIKHHYPY